MRIYPYKRKKTTVSPAILLHRKDCPVKVFSLSNEDENLFKVPILNSNFYYECKERSEPQSK